ncbi:hypothetical protein OSB04_001596 [Centaurea solstitialis]|uniref:GRF-type domain-containing protein n=1 Tax=Centaurea solstitialis TaxID=347529 RepID=A0AA38U301_9ASTR|nr:hypothetical protein OSB04_001596 [Centaurea solstitialis]
MSSSSSSHRIHFPKDQIEDEFCLCGDRLVVKTSWTHLNPGRRFLSCRNYGTSHECKKFKWLDAELPNQYYKDMLFNFHLQFKGFNDNPNMDQLEESKKEVVKLMEELSLTKSKNVVYDRIIMFQIVVIVVLCIVIGAIAF